MSEDSPDTLLFMAIPSKDMKMKTKLNHQFLLTVLLIGAFIGTAHAETTVGRWCDKQIPTMPKFNGIMAIVITDDGAVELRTRRGRPDTYPHCYCRPQRIFHQLVRLT